VQKLINSHENRKELNFLIITSFLILALMAISPAETSAINLSLSSPPKEGHTSEEADQKKIKISKLRIFTAIPVMCIALAELLIFSGRMGAAVWVHIGILIALSLSNIFIKDPEVHKIHQALMLLPVLRLINLSMPIFSATTLYTFIFVYGRERRKSPFGSTNGRN